MAGIVGTGNSATNHGERHFHFHGAKAGKVVGDKEEVGGGRRSVGRAYEGGRLGIRHQTGSRQPSRLVQQGPPWEAVYELALGEGLGRMVLGRRKSTRTGWKAEAPRFGACLHCQILSGV